MTKLRECKKGCGYPALKARQFCLWHFLARQSSDVQASYAMDRLAMATGEHVARVKPSEWPPGERWCAGCQSFVPLFYCSGSRCKACSSLAAHERRVEDNYGITPARYKAIFEQQGGKCAICRNTPRTIRFAVDHDHKTNEVRGILCKRCNHDLLGGGHDDIGILWRAVEYLLFPPAQNPVPPSRDAVLFALGARLDLLDRLAAPRPTESLPAPF